jgi:hypothetical protein
MTPTSSWTAPPVMTCSAVAGDWDSFSGGDGHDVAYGGLGEDYCYYGSVEEMHSCIDWTD